MEESIDLVKAIDATFGLPRVDANSYSPLSLAFMGDCVFDLVIKTLVLHQGNQQVQKMHQMTSRYVQASTQSAMMRILQEHLTEEERAIYKRGRNAKSVSPAKNQSLTDYRRATGFEALLGYLYIEGRYQRMLDLIVLGLNAVKEKEN